MTEPHVYRMGRQWLEASERERHAVAPAMRNVYMEAAIETLRAEVKELRAELGRLAAGQRQMAAGGDDEDISAGAGRVAVRDPAWPSEGDVLTAVARRCGVTVADIVGPRQIKAHVRPRQIAMWLLVRAARLTMREAAAAVGRCDHATVAHAIRRVEMDDEMSGIARGLAEACGWAIREDADACG